MFPIPKIHFLMSENTSKRSTGFFLGHIGEELAPLIFTDGAVFVHYA